MDLNLHNKVALCTASTEGLGLETAKALAREGASVSICSRNTDNVERARAELAQIGDGEVLAIGADITDRDEVKAFVEKTADDMGGIDCVVTSTGGSPKMRFESTGDEDWYHVFNLLVMSVVWTTKFTYPYLRESETGSIVNITSQSVSEVIDRHVLSNSIRRAVIGLMKTQSREFGPEVRVNAVLPGAHDTPRVDRLVEKGLERGDWDTFEEGQNRYGSNPLQKLGDSKEFGNLVAFLSSERASHINGAEIPVEGGKLRS